MKFQKLGIEIRKIGNLSGLYNDVDITLSSYQIPDGGVSKSLQSATVAHSLQKMLKVGRYFDVCTIQKCAEMCHIHISKERMQVYSAIHCIDWSEMTPDYRQVIVSMVLDDFRTVLV